MPSLASVRRVCVSSLKILYLDLLPTSSAHYGTRVQVLWQRPMKSNSLTEIAGELKLLLHGRYVRNGFKLPVLWNSGETLDCTTLMFCGCTCSVQSTEIF